MTALAEQEIDTPKTTPTARLVCVGILWLVVTAGLIVCHSCHAGDHDDELSVPLMEEKN
jgi:hypothetical protein